MMTQLSNLRPAIFAVCLAIQPVWAASDTRHPVPREHPRLLGSRDHLQQLAKAGPMHTIARRQSRADREAMITRR